MHGNAKGISSLMDEDRADFCHIASQTIQDVAEKSALEPGLLGFVEEDDERDSEPYRRWTAGSLVTDDPN
jgi:hypothetical protein